MMISLKKICGEILARLNKHFEKKEWHSFGACIYEMYSYIVLGIEELIQPIETIQKKPTKKEDLN